MKQIALLVQISVFVSILSFNALIAGSSQDRSSVAMRGGGGGRSEGGGHHQGQYGDSRYGGQEGHHYGQEGHHYGQEGQGYGHGYDRGYNRGFNQGVSVEATEGGIPYYQAPVYPNSFPDDQEINNVYEENRYPPQM